LKTSTGKLTRLWIELCFFGSHVGIGCRSFTEMIDYIGIIGIRLDQVQCIVDPLEHVFLNYFRNKKTEGNAMKMKYTSRNMELKTINR
jgi:hypothetical protein